MGKSELVLRTTQRRGPDDVPPTWEDDGGAPAGGRRGRNTSAFKGIKLT